MTSRNRMEMAAKRFKRLFLVAGDPPP
jgi:hypothetical protein